MYDLMLALGLGCRQSLSPRAGERRIRFFYRVNAPSDDFEAILITYKMASDDFDDILIESLERRQTILKAYLWNGK
jgi:hypothetical protein